MNEKVMELLEFEGKSIHFLAEDAQWCMKFVQICLFG